MRIIVFVVYRFYFYRGIAQLVEHWSPKPSAEGSSPSAPATSERTLLRSDFCLHKNQSHAPSFLLFRKKLRLLRLCPCKRGHNAATSLLPFPRVRIIFGRWSHVGAKFALLRFSLSRKTSARFLTPPYPRNACWAFRGPRRAPEDGVSFF